MHEEGWPEDDPRSGIPAAHAFTDALLEDPPALPPRALKLSAVGGGRAERSETGRGWPRIRAVDMSATLGLGSGSDSGDEGWRDSESSRATVRNERRRVVTAVEEDEDDDESMVIAMRYLGNAQFRKAIEETEDEELLGYLRARRLL